MGLTMEQQQVRALLTETVTLLCKNGLQFSHELGIEALIGITLDQEEVFLVSIKETLLADRKDVCNSLVNPSCTDEAVESARFALVPETFMGKEGTKGTRHRGHRERNNLNSYSDVVDSDAVFVTKSGTQKNSLGATRTDIFFEEIDRTTDIFPCNYEIQRKGHGDNSSGWTSLTVAVDRKKSLNISSDSQKPSTAAVINETTDCNGLEMSSEACVIEMKREAIDEDENAENSCMAVGSLFPNSFDDCNGWSWKPSHWKSRQMSEKTSSDKQVIRYNSSTSIWNTRSQKSRAKQSCVRAAADVRPDETDARRCPICGMVSLNWNMYLRHIRKHQPGMYRCPFCGKSFSGSTNLRGHLAVHTNIREFTCHLCDKAYAYKKDLSEHLIVKHGQLQSRFHNLANFSKTAIADLLEENIE